jgi:hypothetical protein
LLVGELTVKSNDVGSKLLELLRENDASLRKIFALQLLDAFGGPLHQVGEANAKFNHPPVVVVIKGFGYDTTLVQDGPEFVAAPRIVVTDTDRRLAGIAPHDDKLHAFAKMVWERPHEDSLLCLLTFLFSFEPECALF